MPLAVVRAVASPRIGAGHVMRCLVLADALAAHGWQAVLACDDETLATVPALAGSSHRSVVLREGADPAAELRKLVPAGCDLLLVDDYALGEAFETPLHGWAGTVLAIDDLANRSHDCNLLVDACLGRRAEDYAGLVPAGCRVLVGPDHALLRPQFTARRPEALARRGAAASRLLVSLGGTDPHGLADLVLEGIAASKLAPAVDVVTGLLPASDPDRLHRLAGSLASVRFHAGVEDMAGLMTDADLAVGAGGGSSWERCCLGLPTVLIVTARNQMLQAEAIAERGAAVLLGWHENVTPAVVAAAIDRLGGDRQCLKTMAAAAAALCDGQGAARLMASIDSLVRSGSARPQA